MGWFFNFKTSTPYLYLFWLIEAWPINPLKTTDSLEVDRPIYSICLPNRGFGCVQLHWEGVNFIHAGPPMLVTRVQNLMGRNPNPLGSIVDKPLGYQHRRLLRILSILWQPFMQPSHGLLQQFWVLFLWWLSYSAVTPSIFFTPSWISGGKFGCHFSYSLSPTPYYIYLTWCGRRRMDRGVIY